MPRRAASRSYFETDDQHYTESSSVKTSLSSICRANSETSYDPRPIINEELAYCNKLRVYISLVAKQHLFNVMNARTLDFEPDQNYYGRVRTMIVDGKLRKSGGEPVSYAHSLEAAKDQVEGRIAVPVHPDGGLPATYRAQIMGYYMKQLAENLDTHVWTHAFHCLETWRRNRIRAVLPAADYNGSQQRAKINAYWTGLAPDHSIKRTYNQLKQELQQRAKGQSTREVLDFMFRLARASEGYQTATGRTMKLFAVVPQAAISVAPIRIDSKIMMGIWTVLSGDKMAAREAFKLAGGGRLDHWSTMFKTDQIGRLRKKHVFGRSILTDGVYASILFLHAKPKKDRPPLTKKVKRVKGLDDPPPPGQTKTAPGKRPRKRRKVDPEPPPPPPVVVDAPGRLYTEAAEYTPAAGLVAVDPGITRILTAVRLDKPDLPELKLTRGEYRDGSRMNWKLSKVGAQSASYRRDMQPITAAMNAAPSSKSVTNFGGYLAALSNQWLGWWAAKSRLKLRKINFYAWRKREAFMDRLTNRVAAYSDSAQPTVLFGDGANGGGWGRLRGVGFKGPVLEIQQRLAKRCRVIKCSEFRTSKLCLDCGRPNGFHNHGTTYCKHQCHRRVENRDVAAAWKIGARYLAVKAKRGLGPWDQSVKKAQLDQQHPRGAVLRQALTEYQVRIAETGRDYAN